MTKSICTDATPFRNNHNCYYNLYTYTLAEEKCLQTTDFFFFFYATRRHRRHRPTAAAFFASAVAADTSLICASAKEDTAYDTVSGFSPNEGKGGGARKGLYR